MTEKEHNEVLQTAFDILASVAGSVRIVGEGSGRFLVADLGDHRIEFYATDHGFVVDQAIHKEVQGERTFTTIGEALSCASDWLTCKPPVSELGRSADSRMKTSRAGILLVAAIVATTARNEERLSISRLEANDPEAILHEFREKISRR